MSEWKLVPVEPTPEMLKAAFDALENYPLEGNIRRHYRAMLAAAPTPPADPCNGPEASALIDNELAARGWPSNPKSAARAGWDAAMKRIATPAEVTRLAVERDALREALKAVLPFVATKAVGCHGDKCREPWCHSCNGDEDAAAAAQRGRDACHAANAALARAKEKK